MEHELGDGLDYMLAKAGGSQIHCAAQVSIAIRGPETQGNTGYWVAMWLAFTIHILTGAVAILPALEHNIGRSGELLRTDSKETNNSAARRRV